MFDFDDLDDIPVPLKTHFLGSDDPELLVVLLHGIAVPGNDLVPFAKELLLDLPARTAALVPEGPCEVGIGLGWWFISEDDRANAKPGAPPRDVIQRLSETVRQTCNSFSKKPRCILGGFSQGSIVAAHCLTELWPSGLLVLSGFCLPEILGDFLSREMNGSSGAFKVLVTHGISDETVAVEKTKEDIQRLQKTCSGCQTGLALDVFFHSGGHEVGSATAGVVARWIRGESLPASSGDSMPTALEASAARPSVDSMPTEVEASAARPSGRSRGGFGAFMAKRGGAAEEAKPASGGYASPAASSMPEAANTAYKNDGAFHVGETVRILSRCPKVAHLRGARARLEAWDASTGLWELHVISTGVTECFAPSDLERYLSEEERRRAAIANNSRNGSPADLQKMLSASIDPLFDHPGVLDLLWPKDKMQKPGSEAISIGGVMCRVVRPEASPSTNGHSRTLIFFPGCSDSALNSVDATIKAYAHDLGAFVVTAFLTPKLSSYLPEVRALIAALPKEMTKGTLLVHGVGGGSIAAVHVAADRSYQSDFPCRLLVVESGVGQLKAVPGMAGMIGCMACDPIGQEAKLAFVRCPVVLLKGSDPVGRDHTMAAVKTSLESLAAACPSPPLILQEASVLRSENEPRLAYKFKEFACKTLNVEASSQSPIADAKASSQSPMADAKAKADSNHDVSTLGRIWDVD